MNNNHINRKCKWWWNKLNIQLHVHVISSHLLDVADIDEDVKTEEDADEAAVNGVGEDSVEDAVSVFS